MVAGSLLIACSALIWGLFPLLTSKSGTSLDPLWNSAFSTLISIIPFLIILIVRNRWHEFTNKTAVRYAVTSATFIGVCYYALVFIGSSLTSPQNTAILLLIELITSAILFVPIKEERLVIRELIGGALLFFSALLVVGGKMTQFTNGDWIIISASLFTPFGNLYAKKARTLISSESYLFIRAVWSGVFLCLIALLFGRSVPTSIAGQDLWVLLITGTVMLGLSKILWTEGLARLKITSALAIHCAVAPSVTFLGGFLIFHQVPSLQQLMSLPMGVLGVVVLLGFL